MQFTTLSPGTFLALALVIAGILALLQYLRIRPRRMRVVTTLFWQQASDQIRARSLFERFRHLKTYLLLLVCALLILLALAKPVLDSTSRPYRVVVLDAGMLMTAADGRFDKALDLVRGEAGSTAEERVAVVVADPEPRLLKHFDEGLAVLKGRLDTLTPAEMPVAQTKALRVAEALLAPHGDGELVLVAAQPVELKNPNIRVLPAGQGLDNAFVLSTTFVPNPGNPTKGEFRWRIGYNGLKGGNVTAELKRQGKSLFSEKIQFEPGDVKLLSVPQIPADGSILTAEITGDDAIKADSSVEYRVPNRRSISLTATGDRAIPEALESVTEGLHGVAVGKSADSLLISVGSADSGAKIVVQPFSSKDEPQGETGDLLPVTATAHPLTAGLVFEDALCRAPSVPLSVSKTRAPLLLAGDAPVAVIDTSTNTIIVADTLLDAKASVVRRTGYFVFWERAFQQLAGWDDAPITLSPAQAAPTAAASVRLKADMANVHSVHGAAAELKHAGAGIQLWQLVLGVALALILLEAALNLKGKAA